MDTGRLPNKTRGACQQRYALQPVPGVVGFHAAPAGIERQKRFVEQPLTAVRVMRRFARMAIVSLTASWRCRLAFFIAPILTPILLLGSFAPSARAEGGVEVGLLTCTSQPGSRLNLIVYSSITLDCVFKTPEGEEGYQGKTGIGLGLDLNWKRQETINFAVISASADVRIGSHAMAGWYAGGKASATLGVGAAALLGAGGKGVALEPLAIESSTGLGVAGGIGYLTLEPAQS